MKEYTQITFYPTHCIFVDFDNTAESTKLTKLTLPPQGVIGELIDKIKKIIGEREVFGGGLIPLH